MSAGIAASSIGCVSSEGPGCTPVPRDYTACVRLLPYPTNWGPIRDSDKSPWTWGPYGTFDELRDRSPFGSLDGWWMAYKTGTAWDPLDWGGGGAPSAPGQRPSIEPPTGPPAVEPEVQVEPEPWPMLVPTLPCPAPMVATITLPSLLDPEQRRGANA